MTSFLRLASEPLGSPSASETEVFTPREIARASGVPLTTVLRLIQEDVVSTIPGWNGYLSRGQAVRAGRLAQKLPSLPVTSDLPSDALSSQGSSADQPHRLFAPHRLRARSTGMPAVVSGSAHVLLLLAIVWSTAAGLSPSASTEQMAEPMKLRLVYLALPGPGGGGGGGGARQRIPPPKAERKGPRRLSSPLPERKPQSLEAPPKPVPEPETLKAEQLPPVLAPIVTAPADQRDRVGVLEQTQAQADSRGPGTGGGVGSGRGTGLGEGDGAGVGPGSGGGTGGGPYRPGSGIEPPRLLREVRPDYTEAARRLNIEGVVLLEIVVRQDGTVGDAHVVKGLDGGLDQRAIQAVKQWRFAAARRLGRPVDVLVEVAVEFRLR